WDPDNDRVSNVTAADVDGDGTQEYVYDSDGDGSYDKYYDPNDGQIKTYKTQKTIDVNNDDKDETATDADNNPSNGYEKYSSVGTTATYSTDGDGDGKIDYFIDTNGDGKPDKYWDPDNDRVSNVTAADVDNDGTDEYVYDSDGDGKPDKYWDPNTGKVSNVSAADVDGDGNYEYTYDSDGNGTYDKYYDPDGKTSAVVSTDGDGDGKTDYFIDTNGDGKPDKYWDPDSNTITNIVTNDYNGDGISDWGIDTNGDGIVDRYYKCPNGPVLPLFAVQQDNGYVPSPNPFKPAQGNATFVFDMVSDGNATIDIYDMSGRKVAVLVDDYRTKGRHQVKWNGGNGEFNAHDGEVAGNSDRKLASGIYIIRYKLPSKTVMRKIGVMK
ncbi:MAG: hypothetical protein CVT47_03825, partial [Thermoplasmata archaeon HGW-Thermoplasmata-2]